ncbi:DNA-binding protein [Crenobacter sp. SG2303]|uniref:DNA-binding protein n=1 Tax=Crenobacter oryzisoli TaxID=3056844 RepID=A0ABT7XV81_9NEIS|nr:DNA-binding protein [Crenobacter sp. SG2303]MDN0077692.1 DNA-binding protein [Crenobacter sp. SG2303]
MSLPPETLPSPAPRTTRERARAIAERILREHGELAGAQRVRDELGYGSLQTINEALRELRRDWAARLERSLSLPELPAPLAADAAVFLQDWWQRSLDQAQQGYAAERDAWAREREEAAAQRAATEQALVAAHQAGHQVRAELQRAEQLIAEQGRTLVLLQDELARLREQQQAEQQAAAQQRQQLAAELHDAREQAEQQQRQAATRLALLNDELLALQARHDQEQAQWQQREQRERREQAAQRELLQQKVASQAQALAQAEQRGLGLQEQLDTLQQQRDAERHQAAAQQQSAAAAQAALGSVQAELERAAAERDEARRLLEVLLQRLPPASAATP